MSNERDETERALEALRKERGYTREQLAARTNGMVTISTIYRIEKGLASGSMSVRRALAEALGVPMNDIQWPAENEVRTAQAEKKRQVNDE